ncbi:MAG TPA: hypothetical protein VLM37_05850 [Fibrobacteraceae bacterium]|nr:hypothetical protein [Fibrobacteraceae bacterium]
MNRVFKVLALAGLLTIGASAQMGIGYDQSLAGCNGVALNYKVNGSFLFNGILNVYNDGSKTNADVALQGLFSLVSVGNVNAFLGAGLDYTTVKDEADNAIAYLEVPFRIEYQIVPNMLSVHTSMGIAARATGDTKTWGVTGNLVGNAGVTLWFKAGKSSPSKSPKAKRAKAVEEAPAPAPVPAASVSDEDEYEDDEEEDEDDDEYEDE